MLGGSIGRTWKIICAGIWEQAVENARLEETGLRKGFDDPFFGEIVAVEGGPHFAALKFDTCPVKRSIVAKIAIRLVHFLRVS